jgi:hypothetical protein
VLKSLKLIATRTLTERRMRKILRTKPRSVVRLGRYVRTTEIASLVRRPERHLAGLRSELGSGFDTSPSAAEGICHSGGTKTTQNLKTMSQYCLIKKQLDRSVWQTKVIWHGRVTWTPFQSVIEKVSRDHASQECHKCLCIGYKLDNATLTPSMMHLTSELSP